MRVQGSLLALFFRLPIPTDFGDFDSRDAAAWNVISVDPARCLDLARRSIPHYQAAHCPYTADDLM